MTMLGRAGDGKSGVVALTRPENRQGSSWALTEVHINRHKTTGAGRLVMRMRGVLKLLLNTPIFPTTRRAISLLFVSF